MATQTDYETCERAWHHVKSTRHNKNECPVEGALALPLTVRDVKNKILARMEGIESIDAIVGETRDGGCIILTERRVFEVYEVQGTIYANVKNTAGSWEEYDYA